MILGWYLLFNLATIELFLTWCAQCTTPTYSEFYHSDQMISMLKISLFPHFWCKYGMRFAKVATWNTQLHNVQ